MINMKKFKKAQIAGAVMLATAGVAVSTAQAESLLAPLVINSSVGDGNGQRIETFLSLKLPAVLNPFDSFGNNVHYRWIQKNHPATGPSAGPLPDGAILNPGTRGVGGLPTDPLKYWNPGVNDPIDALRDLKRNCVSINSYGRATPHDMMYQSTVGDANFSAVTNNSVADGGFDNSVASGFPGPFSGMLVLNVPGAKEGNFSGFAYIVNTIDGTLLDYKLLNNHHSEMEGNFASGFISKKAIEFSWLPDTVVNTMWYTAVTSKYMGQAAETAGVYDATVKIGTHARVEIDGTSNQQDPSYYQGGIGVYNNDEAWLSSSPEFDVTCAGLYDRRAFVDPSQVAFTANGGWTRRSITPIGGKKIDAKGAITYKIERGTGLGFSATSFQIETSGTLPTAKSRINKPY